MISMPAAKLNGFFYRPFHLGLEAFNVADNEDRSLEQCVQHFFLKTVKYFSAYSIKTHLHEST